MAQEGQRNTDTLKSVLAYAVTSSNAASPTRQLLGSTPIPFGLTPGPVAARALRKTSSIVSQLRSMVQALSAAEDQLLGPMPATARLFAPARPSVGRSRDDSATPARKARRGTALSLAEGLYAAPVVAGRRRRSDSASRAIMPTPTASASEAPPPAADYHELHGTVRPALRVVNGSPPPRELTVPAGHSRIAVIRHGSSATPLRSSREGALRPSSVGARTRKGPITSGPPSVISVVKRKGTVADRSHELTFACLGAADQCSEIRKALLARGWTDISGSNPRFARFVWAIDDGAVGELLDDASRIVNHFQGTRCITTKSGLCRTVRNLSWLAAADWRDFFPRCYDLGDKDDRADFEDDFRLTAAVCVLRRFAAACESSQPCSLPFRRSLLSLCLRAVSLFLRDVDGSHGSLDLVHDDLSLTAEEWESVCVHSYTLHADAHGQGDALSSPRGHDRERVAASTPLHLHTSRLLRRLAVVAPHTLANGTANIWVVKPGAASRGVGVVLHSRLRDILALAPNGKVVQRYMESPALIDGAGGLVCDLSVPQGPAPTAPAFKFDIRQLVLVTSWRPLTIYLYDTFYLRVASVPYDTSPAGITHRLAHVCNTSIQKPGCGDGDTLTAADLAAMCVRALGEVEGTHAYTHRVLAGMRSAVIATLRAAEPHAHHRHNAFQLYGADFVLDSSLHPWLLEFNLSPALNKRTPYMTGMLAAMADGLVDVVLAQYRQPRADSDTRASNEKATKEAVPMQAPPTSPACEEGTPPPPDDDSDGSGYESDFHSESDDDDAAHARVEEALPVPFSASAPSVDAASPPGEGFGTWKLLYRGTDPTPRRTRDSGCVNDLCVEGRALTRTQLAREQQCKRLASAYQALSNFQVRMRYRLRQWALVRARRQAAGGVVCMWWRRVLTRLRVLARARRCGAVAMQRLWRRHASRLHVCALTIQCAWRVCLATRALTSLRRLAACVRLQCWARVIAAVRTRSILVSARRLVRWWRRLFHARLRCVAVIQAAYKRWRFRQQWLRVRAACILRVAVGTWYLCWRARRNAAARQLQCAWRADANARHLRHTHAAVVIQRAWRRVCALRYLRARAAARHTAALAALRVRVSAGRVQRCWFAARERAMSHCATLVQALTVMLLRRRRQAFIARARARNCAARTVAAWVHRLCAERRVAKARALRLHALRCATSSRRISAWIWRQVCGQKVRRFLLECVTAWKRARRARWAAEAQAWVERYTPAASVTHTRGGRASPRPSGTPTPTKPVPPMAPAEAARPAGVRLFLASPDDDPAAAVDSSRYSEPDSVLAGMPQPALIDCLESMMDASESVAYDNGSVDVVLVTVKKRKKRVKKKQTPKPPPPPSTRLLGIHPASLPTMTAPLPYPLLPAAAKQPSTKATAPFPISFSASQMLLPEPVASFLSARARDPLIPSRPVTPHDIMGASLPANSRYGPTSPKRPAGSSVGAPYSSKVAQRLVNSVYAASVRKLPVKGST